MQANVSTIPDDVLCLQISVAGNRAVTRSFDVMPGTSPTLLMTGLPVGDATFTAAAIGLDCSQSSGAQPTWISDPTAATLTAGQVTVVSLILHKNSEATVNVGFDDDAGTLSDGGVMTPAPDLAVGSTQTLSLIAGALGGDGNADGIGPGARFFNASGVASDGAGTLYVADTLNYTIRRVDLATGEVSTLAGTPGQQGSANGTGPTARFNHPVGLALDGAGNLYVADDQDATIRQVVLATGTVTTLAGVPGQGAGSSDGVGAVARFSQPIGLAYDGAGSLFVVDYDTIRRVDLASAAVTTLAGVSGQSGSVDGMGPSARFNDPSFVAADGAGNLYVTDSRNHTIRQVVVATGAVTTLAGSAGQSGSVDAIGAAARFNFPRGVASDGAGNLYIGDLNNRTIRKLVLATGAVSTIAGATGRYGSADGTGTAARFASPEGLASDGAGNVYLADRGSSTIRKLVLATAVVTTLAGTAPPYGTADGTGATARFNDPYRVVSDGAGALYVADSGNNAIRQIILATGA